MNAMETVTYGAPAYRCVRVGFVTYTGADPVMGSACRSA
jgi:hypothetical protein